MQLSTSANAVKCKCNQGQVQSSAMLCSHGPSNVSAVKCYCSQLQVKRSQIQSTSAVRTNAVSASAGMSITSAVRYRSSAVRCKSSAVKCKFLAVKCKCRTVKCKCSQVTCCAVLVAQVWATDWGTVVIQKHILSPPVVKARY